MELDKEKVITVSNNIVIIQTTCGILRLPDIKIHPYDGDPLKWINFHAAFKGFIDDDASIPIINKFDLLKRLLCGRLKNMMDYLSPTEENYKKSLQELKDRCYFPRIIINHYLDEILDFPKIEKANYRQLNNLLTKAEAHTSNLKSMGQPVESWDTFLVHVIEKKLDYKTREDWEFSLERDQKPSFEKLTDFLRKQTRLLEIKMNYAKY